MKNKLFFLLPVFMLALVSCFSHTEQAKISITETFVDNVESDLDLTITLNLYYISQKRWPKDINELNLFIQEKNIPSKSITKYADKNSNLTFKELENGNLLVRYNKSRKTNKRITDNTVVENEIAPYEYVVRIPDGIGVQQSQTPQPDKQDVKPPSPLTP